MGLENLVQCSIRGSLCISTAISLPSHTNCPTGQVDKLVSSFTVSPITPLQCISLNHLCLYCRSGTHLLPECNLAIFLSSGECYPIATNYHCPTYFHCNSDQCSPFHYSQGPCWLHDFISEQLLRQLNIQKSPAPWSRHHHSPYPYPHSPHWKYSCRWDLPAGSGGLNSDALGLRLTLLKYLGPPLRFWPQIRNASLTVFNFPRSP